jgi:thioredoxin-dependent peroxiredoxin
MSKVEEEDRTHTYNTEEDNKDDGVEEEVDTMIQSSFGSLDPSLRTKKLPSLDVGDQIPHFDAKTQKGGISFHDFIGGCWCVLVSFKSSYHAVSTSDLSILSKLSKQFQARNARVLAIGMDPQSRVEAWIEEINVMTKTELTFPVICDTGGFISHSLALLDDPSRRVVKSRPSLKHSILIVDPFKVLRTRIDYPSNVGRNMYEILRSLDALQLADYYRVALPANWEQGGEVMVAPGVTKAEHAVHFPGGITEATPYFLRSVIEEDSSDEEDLA